MINNKVSIIIFLSLTMILSSQYLFIALGSSFESDIHWPTTEWLEGDPKEFGLDESKINDMITTLNTTTNPVEHITISKNGYMLTEYYGPSTESDKNFTYFQAVKGITAMLVGIAINKSILPSVDTSIWTFFNISEFDNVNEQKEAITIKHLLTCSAGFQWVESNSTTFYNWRESSNWAKHVLDLPMEATPGETFRYNSASTHLLNCILAQKINTTIWEFASQYLFDPLGIHIGFWQTDPQGINDGGVLIYISAHDLAKIGMLLVNNGFWDGEQLLSTNYVHDMFNDHFNVGYGYQFWLENVVTNGENVWSTRGLGDAKRITLFFNQQIVTTISCYSASNWTNSIVTEYIVPAISSSAKNKSTTILIYFPILALIAIAINKKRKRG